MIYPQELWHWCDAISSIKPNNDEMRDFLELWRTSVAGEILCGRVVVSGVTVYGSIEISASDNAIICGNFFKNMRFSDAINACLIVKP